MKQNLQIFYEDPHIIVCYKPGGIATQSRKPGQPDMEHIILNHIASSGHGGAKKTTCPYLAVIHRLDQPVSGVLVFAKTPEAARNLNKQLTTQGFGKHYLALVDGRPRKNQGTLTDYIVKDGRTNTSRICGENTPGAKWAQLSYCVLPETDPRYTGIFSETFGGNLRDTSREKTLLEITLNTGRHHQIRVQLAHMGCPITGDTKYNPDAAGISGWQTLSLCAYKLSFRHPINGQAMLFDLLDHTSCSQK